MQSEAQINIQLNRGFLLIETNSEFLTVVRKSVTADAGKGLCLATQYLKLNAEVKLDYENFIQCFVQLAYMIYTSKYYMLTPQILPMFVRIEQGYGYGGDRRFSVIIYYTISNLPGENNSYMAVVLALYKFMKDFYEQYEKKIKQNTMDQQAKISIRGFMQQLAFLEAKVTQLEEPQRQLYFFLLLEETDLFRENSMLLKIKNYSMMDYIKMKFGKFKQYREQDEKQVRQYNNQRRKIKFNVEEIRNKERMIEKNLLNFFQELEKSNPNKFKLKLQPDQLNRVKLNFIYNDSFTEQFQNRISRLFQQGVMQNEPVLPSSKEKIAYSEYQIEYNSERNIVCVKLILSSIACSSESTDYIMFQANAITFDSANISLEFVEEKSQKNAPSKKYLAFRGTSSFNNTKEPILEKVLVLMDLTMLTAKICEPELLSMRRSFIFDKDTYKISLVTQKLNHYSKLLLKCAKKVYSE